MTTRRALGVFGSLLLAIPVVATLHGSAVPLSLRLEAGAILLTTLISPTLGLCVLVGILPLSSYIWNLSSQPFENAAAVAEMWLTPFLLGASLRFAIAGRAASSWLARPAIVLGCIIGVDGVLALAAQQQSTAWPGDFLRALLRHLIDGYYSDPSAFLPVHNAAQWLEGLALAVFVERLVRGSERAQSAVVRVFLASASIVAAFSWKRLAEISLRRAHPLAAAAAFLSGSEPGSRISPLYADVNAAGSLYALYFVVAAWLTFKDRRPSSAIAAAFLALALWTTHSRAALAAAVQSLAAMWLVRQRLSRARIIGIAILAGGLIVGVAMWGPSRAAQSSQADSVQVRVHMTEIGLRLSREHPLFGVGLGQFKRASRAFITPEFIAFFPQAASGENAHNNFVQILADLGLVGFLGFVWLLAAPAGAIIRVVASHQASDRLVALAGGVVAFLITCLLGHPLLIAEVLWLFLLVLGMAAGFAPARVAATSRPWGNFAAVAVILFVLGSVPARWSYLRHNADLDHVVIGATQVVGTQDDIAYRLADPRSVWFVTARARVLEIPLRLTNDSRSPCLVGFDIDGRSADTVQPIQGAWLLARFEFQPSSTDPVSRRLDMRLDDAACHLMVGTFRFRQ